MPVPQRQVVTVEGGDLFRGYLRRAMTVFGGGHQVTVGEDHVPATRRGARIAGERAMTRMVVLDSPGPHSQREAVEPERLPLRVPGEEHVVAGLPQVHPPVDRPVVDAVVIAG